MILVALQLTQAKLVASDGREMEVKGVEPPTKLGRTGDLGKFLLRHLRDVHSFLIADRRERDELFRRKGKDPEKEKEPQQKGILAEDMADEE